MKINLPSASVERHENKIHVAISGVADGNVVNVRFHSDRNRRITRHSDRSPLAPASHDTGLHRYNLVWGAEAPPQARDIYFPVIDIDLASLAETVVAEVNVPGATLFTINSWKTQGHIVADRTGAAVIDGDELEHWENWLLAVGPDGHAFGTAEFALNVALQPENGRAELNADILGNDWSGIVDVQVTDPAELLTTLNVQTYIRDPHFHDPANGALSLDMGNAAPSCDLSKDALEDDLGLCLNFILAARNRTAGSPYENGLYLFYDVDARTWRTPNWTWTWGPSIRVALDAVAAAPSLAPRAGELRDFALELGELSLGVLIDNPGHPSDGMGIARWDPLPEVRRGSEKFASLADPLFLAGWAWGRLHDETGDERYIEGMRVLASAAERQIKEYGVVQQDWLFERERWLERILDEAGFGIKGLAELYRLTDDENVSRLVSEYLDPLIDRLGRQDGLWDRFWYIESDARTPSENMIRGLGWAMEGLLSAYTATQKDTYLSSAKKMAAIVIANQREDGSWTFEFDRPVEEVGYSDKGTPLWSVLLYRLFDETGDPQHLQAARAALEWSRSHLRRNPNDESRGGIIGIGPQSGVAYRPWFRLCCTYSTAFTGAAIIHELNHQRKSSS